MYEMFTDKIEHIIRESISELKPEKRNKLFEGYMEALVRYCEFIKKYSNAGLPNDERVKAEYRQIDRTMRFIEESLTRDEVELAQKEIVKRFGNVPPRIPRYWGKDIQPGNE